MSNQTYLKFWTMSYVCHSRGSGNPVRLFWIPIFMGMTNAQAFVPNMFNTKRINKNRKLRVD